MTVVLAVLVTALLSTTVQAAPSAGRSDTAGSSSASNSVVFTSDPSQDLVIDRATGLLPLISAASDVLPLALDGIAAAERRLRTMIDLLVSARQRHRSAVRAFAAANRLVADNVRDAAQLQSGYSDLLAGISATEPCPPRTRRQRPTQPLFSGPSNDVVGLDLPGRRSRQVL